MFSGFTFPKYDPDRENLYQFQPPIAKRNKLPKFSNNLFRIDLDAKQLILCSNLQESGSYNGSILNISDSCNLPELLIHADPKIIMYSERVIDAPQCDLTNEFGSCSLSIVEKKKDSYVCATPVCRNVIHILCDKSIKGKPSENQFCPNCRNLDPATWKPVPGSKRPRIKRK